MKKIFTLVFASALFTTAFAQYGSRDRDFDNRKDVVVIDVNKGFDRGNDRFDGGRYYFTEREKNMQIAQITREYDYKIQAVKGKHFMSWYQKKRQIEILKDQRDREIARVIYKFNDRRNQFNDHGRDKRKNW